MGRNSAPSGPLGILLPNGPCFPVPAYSPGGKRKWETTDSYGVIEGGESAISNRLDLRKQRPRRESIARYDWELEWPLIVYFCFPVQGCLEVLFGWILFQNLRDQWKAVFDETQLSFHRDQSLILEFGLLFHAT